jgi:hypothetical protein
MRSCVPWGCSPIGPPRHARTTRQPRREAVCQAIERLNALEDGVHDRERARLLCITCGTPIDHQTVKTRWQASPVAGQGPLARWDDHAHPDRSQARRPVIPLSARGWEKIRIRRVWHVSRPPVKAWLQRFETAHVAGLVDRRRAPHAPVRTRWRPLMGPVSHLQQAQPDAGACRLWSLRARSDVSVRPIGRVMARHTRLSDALPHVPTRGVTRAPGPHPDTASPRPQSWCMDGRLLDGALHGGRWGSRIILEGSSRTRRAGAMAPPEATWAALMGLDTAGLRDGVPGPLVSDRGGASTSTDVAAVGTRRQVQQATIVRTQGERDQPLMDTHGTIQRRV